MTYQQQPPPPGYQNPPQAPQGYPPQAPQGYPPQDPYQQQQPQQPGGFVYYPPDEAQAAQALDDAAAKSQFSGGNRAPWLKVLGPNGETSWGSVPRGYTGYLDIYLCGSWAAGIPTPFIESVSHFAKTASYPRGVGVQCSDDATCLYCQARDLALASPDPALQESAQNWGKQRRAWVYNAINLSAPQSHYGQDGVMRPFLLGAGAQLQGKLKNLFEVRGGIGRFTNPENGRPIRLIKKKTGPNLMDVEWDAMDLDPRALDPYFGPALQNLWNLKEQIEPSNDEHVRKVLSELRWPIPGAQTAYNASPNPPYPNPYGAPPIPPSMSASAPPQMPPPPPVTSTGVGVPSQPPQGGQMAPPPPPAAPHPPQGGQMGAPPPPPHPPQGGQMGAPPPPPPPPGGYGPNPT